MALQLFESEYCWTLKLMEVLQMLMQTDVCRIFGEPSAANRQDAALKAASAYSTEELSDHERNIVEDIMT